jgi:hypothetical protein
MPAVAPTYRIVVRGELSGGGLNDMFGGLDVVSTSGVTQICGRFVDQSQLYGLLARMRDLGLALVSVNEVDDASGDVRS